ncbi:MAG: STAS domain-containing protein, partial [Candidatus Binatia bacterium]
MQQASKIPSMIKKHDKAVLNEWLKYQLAMTLRSDLIKERELREQSKVFLDLFTEASQQDHADIEAPPWKPVKDMLGEVSRSRALQGFSPTETAMFVFSLKQPLFDLLRREVSGVEELANEIWVVTTLLDKLGLYTTESYQQSREAVISRQQHELLELSTPVVQLWDNILALPLIGTLDSARTQVMMENLLERIVSASALVAIIDITGVPTVDTLVAQHLLKTVAAARLMGADCIISG